MLAVIGLAGLAPPASGAFSAPVDVAPFGASNPQVATDADGDSALTWEFQSGADLRVRARTLSAGGALGPVHDLGLTSGAGFEFGPRVAIDAQGDSVFVWTRSSPTDVVLARRLSAGGTLGTFPIQLSRGGDPGPFSAPEIATDANGDTVFTWVNFGLNPDRVQARTMTARGVLGTVRNVSPAGQIGSQPQVATDATGDSVLTWVREDGIDGDDDRVQARTMSVNGSLGPITDLSAAAGRAFAPQVATDADGDTIFTWLRFNGVRDRVQGRAMSATGTLGATFGVDPAGPSALDPQVATDTNGDSVFTWERFDLGDDRVQARTRTAAGVFGSVTNLSAAGGEAFAQQVASAASGASVFTWLRFDGAADRVQARTMTAAGAFGSTQSLSAVGADGETPQIAVAATTGAAVAAWERIGVVQAARGP